METNVYQDSDKREVIVLTNRDIVFPERYYNDKEEGEYNKLADLISKDGKEHILVSKNGKTALGRFLDYQAKGTISIPGIGSFATIVGLVEYITNSNPTEDFRILSGVLAKQLSKERQTQGLSRKIILDNFKDIVYYANWIKLFNNQNMLERFMENDLPFHRYYMYYDYKRKHHILIHYKDWMNHILGPLKEEIYLNPNYTPERPDVSQILETIKMCV